MTNSSYEPPFPSTHQSCDQSAAIEPLSVAEDSSYRLAQVIAAAAEERKGDQIVLLKVSEVTVLADYFVLVTGYSKVQVRAIARAIEDQVQETLNLTPRRSQGLSEGTWVVEDYGDVLVHIFLPAEREYYNLEAFWGHGEVIPYIGNQPTDLTFEDPSSRSSLSQPGWAR